MATRKLECEKNGVNNEEKLSTEYFRNILETNTANLKRLCDHWDKLLVKYESDALNISNQDENKNHTYEKNTDQIIKKDDDEEEMSGPIRSVVGQANLLMSQRFKQFKDLIDKCEFSLGPMPTRLDDLLGFWEMIKFQVDDVLNKFQLIEDLHNKRVAKLLNSTSNQAKTASSEITS